MQRVSKPAHGVKVLSRRARDELGAMQTNVHELSTERNTALRIFVASRYVASTPAQREFWLEFAWADQEYRAAVRRLAQFCVEHGNRAEVSGEQR
jgi:hypothetical protein